MNLDHRGPLTQVQVESFPIVQVLVSVKTWVNFNQPLLVVYDELSGLLYIK
mgnify:CR=1 FL=1